MTSYGVIELSLVNGLSPFRLQAIARANDDLFLEKKNPRVQLITTQLFWIP